MIENFLQFLLETEALSRKGKIILAGDRPLKDLQVSDVIDNIVIFHSKEGNFLWAKGYTLVFFMDSADSAQKVKSGEYYYPMFPVKTYGNMFTVSPINDIWKKRGTHGEKHTLGAIEAYVDDDQIYVDMLSVRPGFKRNHIATFMINALKEEFPGRKKFWTSKRTEDGSRFFDKYEPEAEENVKTNEDLSWRDAIMGHDYMEDMTSVSPKYLSPHRKEDIAKSKYIPSRHDGIITEYGNWTANIYRNKIVFSGLFNPLHAMKFQKHHAHLFTIDHAGNFIPGKHDEELAFRLCINFVEDWPEVFKNPMFKKWWNKHRGELLGKELGVVDESTVERVDVSKKISYWKQVLKMNTNKNKFALEVLATIESSGKATQRQIDLIEKYVKGDNSRYSSKN